MSLTFTSGLSKPSGVLDKPGSLERPAFDTLYGFDTPQEYLPPMFNIDEDTEANILASSVTNPSGEAQIRYGTDTKDLYVYVGSSTWYKFAENGTV